MIFSQQTISREQVREYFDIYDNSLEQIRCEKFYISKELQFEHKEDYSDILTQINLPTHILYTWYKFPKEKINKFAFQVYCATNFLKAVFGKGLRYRIRHKYLFPIEHLDDIIEFFENIGQIKLSQIVFDIKKSVKPFEREIAKPSRNFGIAFEYLSAFDESVREIHNSTNLYEIIEDFALQHIDAEFLNPEQYYEKYFFIKEYYFKKKCRNLLRTIASSLNRCDISEELLLSAAKHRLNASWFWCNNFTRKKYTYGYLKTASQYEFRNSKSEYDHAVITSSQSNFDIFAMQKGSNGLYSSWIDWLKNAKNGIFSEKIITIPKSKIEKQHKFYDNIYTSAILYAVLKLNCPTISSIWALRPIYNKRANGSIQFAASSNGLTLLMEIRKNYVQMIKPKNKPIKIRIVDIKALIDEYGMVKP